MASLPILIVGTVIGGLATGPAYYFGLRVVNELTPENQRAEVVSSYLIACYAGNSLPVIGVGVLAKATTPETADNVFAAVVALLVIVALVVELKAKTRDEPLNR